MLALRLPQRHSMSAPQPCTDGCNKRHVAECFFSILKGAYLHRKSWSSRADLEDAIKDVVFHFYMRERIRSKGKTPLD